MRIDLHVHTKYSEDSDADIEEIIKRAKSVGLGGIAITDHNTAAGWEEALKIGRRYGILIIRGEEVSSEDGHILALGIHRRIEDGKSAYETVEDIRKAGGVAVAAHPYRITNGLGPEVLRHTDFDGIEVLNSRSPPYINKKGRRLAEDLNKPMTGGSDAHTALEVGLAYTVFCEGIESEKEAIKAIIAGDVYSGGNSQRYYVLVSQNMSKAMKWVKRKGKRI